MKTITPRILPLTLALVMILGMTSAFAAARTVAINKANFPDATFRTYVKRFDKNKNGKLEADELSSVERINVRGKKAIKSLKGIEYFTALGQLDYSNTSVSTLDVRRNTDLWLLHATKAPLTRLKLGRKDHLGELHVDGTKLASIDIVGCPTQLEAATSPDWEFWVSEGRHLLGWQRSPGHQHQHEADEGQQGRVHLCQAQDLKIHQ